MPLPQRALGEAAEGYQISPETIEQEDQRYLNFFLDAIEGNRLRESWKRKSEQSGRKFVVIMLREMNDNDTSLTAEETVTARMKAILDGGLYEASFACFLEVTGAYEDWNDVLDTPIPEQTRAHSFKNWSPISAPN